MFAVVWAWINFTWFASAYDTDDWVYRVMTMVQMVGVIILALGLPPIVRLDRQGRPRRQPGAGRRLRRHAGGHGHPVAARRPAGAGAPSDVPAPTRTTITVAQVGWILAAGRADCPCDDMVLLFVLGVLSSSRARGRRAPEAAARRGTRTTSPSATACSRSSRSARCGRDRRLAGRCDRRERLDDRRRAVRGRRGRADLRDVVDLLPAPRG